MHIDAASDATIRLVSTIGDFVEPLTRFNRDMLELVSSDSFEVVCTTREAIKTYIAQVSSEGSGHLPTGATITANKSAMQSRSDANFEASHAATVLKLSGWLSAHAQEPDLTPCVGDIFNAPSPAGFQFNCGECCGEGNVKCSACRALGRVTCTRCMGDGKNMCSNCNMSGRMNCTSCGGAGGNYVQVSQTVWNSYTNQNEVRYRSEWQRCWSCNAEGKIACSKCGGHRFVSCYLCGGDGTLTCSTCSGRGTITCRNCNGHGIRHEMIRITCEIGSHLDIQTCTDDEEILLLLSSRLNVLDLIELSSNWAARANQDGLNILRKTEITVPITRVSIRLANEEVTITGYGRDVTVFDYQNILSRMLEKDLGKIESAMKRGYDMQSLRDAYLCFIASEVNAGIAGLKRGDCAELTAHVRAELRGAVSIDYAARARKVATSALRRLFAAEIMVRKLLVFSAAPATAIAAYASTRLVPEHSPSMVLGLIFLGFLLTLGSTLLSWRALSKTVAAVNPARSFVLLSGVARLGLLAVGAALGWTAIMSIGLYVFLLKVVPAP